MKKIFKTILIMFNLSLLFMGIYDTKQVFASNTTGHKEYEKINFMYDDEAKLLSHMSKEEREQMLSKVKRKAFGWSTYVKYYNYEIVVQKGTVFSRSNKTSQDIRFSYATADTDKNTINKSASGTIGMKASGKYKGISANLDSTIRGEIGEKNEYTHKEDIDFSVYIAPGKKVSLIAKAVGKLSSGSAKFYVCGVCFKKECWEFIDIESEYYGLYEERITY